MNPNILSRGKQTLTSASFIFFALMTIGVIFCATDSEYNLNQTIARGYISRNAVFFEVQDYSKYMPNGHVKVNEDGEVENAIVRDGYAIIVDATTREPVDPDFVLNNDIIDGGLTRMETLLSSGEDNYIAAIHQGELRGIFYKGNITIPPLVRGRYFTEKECLSRDNLAVIGSDFLESSFSKNGKEYVVYNEKEYEVIGVTGISNASSLDHLIMVNMGSMSQEEQKTGRIYIDGDRSMKEDYHEMEELAPQIFGVGLVRQVAPKTLIDEASGGMYLKTYLKILTGLLFLFIYLSVVVQILKRQNLKIAVMGIYGLSFGRRFISISGSVLLSSLIGLILGLIVDIVLIKVKYFSLPYDLLYKYISIFFGTGLIMIGLMALITALGMRRVNIGEVIRAV